MKRKPEADQDRIRKQVVLWLRHRWGLTQEQVAALLKVSRPRVAQLEEKARAVMCIL